MHAVWFAKEERALILGTEVLNGEMKAIVVPPAVSSKPHFLRNIDCRRPLKQRDSPRSKKCAALHSSERLRFPAPSLLPNEAMISKKPCLKIHFLIQ
jgi:hypothetical protein